MKKTLLVLLAACATLSTATAASAEGGCGRGYHRGPHGGCRANGGAVVVAPGLVVGNFYRGQGYWDGQRYYQHRERYRDGWRYR